MDIGVTAALLRFLYRNSADGAQHGLGRSIFGTAETYIVVPLGLGIAAVALCHTHVLSIEAMASTAQHAIRP